MAVKLTAKDDWQKAEWYFRDAFDCKEFMATFRDHWCNIVWNPVEIVDTDKLTADQRSSMEEDPKKRAENDLSWGFNSYMKQHEECNKLTEPQTDFVSKMVDKITKENAEED